MPQIVYSQPFPNYIPQSVSNANISISNRSENSYQIKIVPTHRNPLIMS
jgi:hypothetical protein